MNDNEGKYTLEHALNLIKEVYQMNLDGIIKKEESDHYSGVESTHSLEYSVEANGYDYVYYYSKTIESNGSFTDKIYEAEYLTRENLNGLSADGESNYINLYDFDELVDVLNNIRRDLILGKIIG